MILAIIPCTAVIGLILSIVAFNQSRGAGIRNQKAFIGIIVGVVLARHRHHRHQITGVAWRGCTTADSSQTRGGNHAGCRPDACPG